MKDLQIRYSLYNIGISGPFGTYTKVCNYYPHKKRVYLGCVAMKDTEALGILAELLGYKLNFKVPKSKIYVDRYGIYKRPYSLKKRNALKIFKMLCMAMGVEVKNG